MVGHTETSVQGNQGSALWAFILDKKIHIMWKKGYWKAPGGPCSGIQDLILFPLTSATIQQARLKSWSRQNSKKMQGNSFHQEVKRVWTSFWTYLLELVFCFLSSTQSLQPAPLRVYSLWLYYRISMRRTNTLCEWFNFIMDQALLKLMLSSTQKMC